MANTAVGQGAVLAFASVGSRVAIILGMPFLTRLYSPADFGVFAFFTAALAIAAVASCWRYDAAIAVSKDLPEAANLSALSALLLLVNCELMLVGVALIGTTLEWWLATPGLAGCLWLLPPTLFAFGCVRIMTAWATREKALGRVAGANAFQPLVLLFQLTAGILSFGAIGLAGGDLAARCSTSSLLAVMNRKAWVNNRSWISWHRMRKAFVRYRRFPQFDLWASLINTTGIYLPIAFLSFSYGAAVVGNFTLSQQVAGLPVLLLGQAVSRVYLSRARQSVDIGAIAENTRRLFRVLTAVAVPYAMLLIVASEDVFVFVFGEMWRNAGLYTCFLAPWLLFVFLASPISPLAQVHERQRNEFLFQTGLLLARTVALSTCFWVSAPLVPIATFGLVSAACWMARLCWLLRLSGNRPSDCAGDLAAVLGYSVPLTAPLVIVKLFRVDEGIVFFVFLALAVPAMFFSIRIVRPLLGLRPAMTHGAEA